MEDKEIAVVVDEGAKDVTAEFSGENYEEVDEAFAKMLSDIKGEDEETESEEGSKEESKETEETEESETEKKPEEETLEKDESFVFDKEKYEKLGIKDEKTLEEFEAKDKKLFHQEKFIGRQGKKMGDQKNQWEEKTKGLQTKIDELNAHKPLTDEEYDEIATTSPSKAFKQRQDDLKVAEKKLATENELKDISNRGIISDTIENYESRVDGMADILKEEGGFELAESFKKDPYSIHPAISVNLAKRVDLAEEVKALKEANKTLEEKAKEAPGKVVERLKKIGKNSASSPSEGEETPSGKKAYDGVLLGLLTPDELKEE